MSCRFGNLKFKYVSGSLNELKASMLSLDKKKLNSGLVDVKCPVHSTEGCTQRRKDIRYGRYVAEEILVFSPFAVARVKSYLSQQFAERYRHPM